MQNNNKDQETEKNLIKAVMAKIKCKIMVMSNKGGVGKSTVAANIADELANQGYKVGILDIDIHGPSQANIFGCTGKRLMADENQKIIPFQPKENLKVVTVAGLLESDDQPIIWRGPLKIGIIKQFIKDVLWGELDYLIIDAPPGTGDEPLTIAQIIPDLDGVVIVTTPQDLALLDSRKAIKFANQLHTKIIGIIENMAYMNCPHCNHHINLFRNTNTEDITSKLGIDTLGILPFEPELLSSMDKGVSFMQNHKNSKAAQIFSDIVNKIKEKHVK